MKIYFTRHGQVFPFTFMGDEMYERGDHPLTPLGEEQAELLGKRLKAMGFAGKIYASPFRRTIQTAVAIAKETGCLIYPFPYIHECYTNDERARVFRGMDIDKIRERFPCIAPEAQMVFPWFAGKAETPEEVIERVAVGLKQVEAAGEDCLLVGHGASMNGVRKYFGVEHPKGMKSWNCGLSCVEKKEGEESFSCLMYYNTEHLPYEKISCNGLMKSEDDIAIAKAAEEAAKALAEEAANAAAGEAADAETAKTAEAAVKDGTALKGE